MFSVLDATLTVSYDEATGEAVLAGSILAQSNNHASDIPEFTLTINCVPAHPHIEFDTEGADFEEVCNDYELIEVYDEGGVIVKAENETSETMLAFFVAEGDSTYTCSLKGEPMTVLTSSCDGQYVYASFFMDKNYNIWFPYAGTITVSEDGVKMNILGTRIK